MEHFKMFTSKPNRICYSDQWPSTFFFSSLIAFQPRVAFAIHSALDITILGRLPITGSITMMSPTNASTENASSISH